MLTQRKEQGIMLNDVLFFKAKEKNFCLKHAFQEFVSPAIPDFTVENVRSFVCNVSSGYVDDRKGGILSLSFEDTCCLCEKPLVRTIILESTTTWEGKEIVLIRDENNRIEIRKDFLSELALAFHWLSQETLERCIIGENEILVAFKERKK